MTAVCVTWKQPDGDHFNGFCTNRFRLTTPPAGVTVGEQCELCVTPMPAPPPTGCYSCPDTPEDEEWPLTYRIRGGIMTVPNVALGTYTWIKENATYKVEYKVTVLGHDWSDVAGMFNGGRLVRPESAPDVPKCRWDNRSDRLSVCRVSGFLDAPAAPGTCNIARNRPATLDSEATIAQILSPQIVVRYPRAAGPPPNPDDVDFMQIVTFDAFYVDQPYGWIPSFLAYWPAGFGVLSGTAIKYFGVSRTNTRVFSDCPSLLQEYSGRHYPTQVYFRFDVIPFAGDPGALRLKIDVSHNSYFELYTGFDKTLGKYISVTQNGSFPLPSLAPYPASPIPPQPYGAMYITQEDVCNTKRYIVMVKESFPADPLGVYPPTIELVGE